MRDRGNSMHGSTMTRLLLIGAAATLGCGDEAKKATVSADTSWQIACVEPGADCSGSLGAHRAREGAPLQVSCSRDETGLSVTLTDPGQKAASAEVQWRPYGRLTIRRLDPTRNRCTVVLEEEERGTNGTLRIGGHCGSDPTSACRVTGDVDVDGWAFRGELSCSGLQFDGLAENGQGPFTLQKPASDDEPIVLQIANCN